MKKLVVFVLIFALAIQAAGCAEGTSGTSEVTPAEVSSAAGETAPGEADPSEEQSSEPGLSVAEIYDRRLTVVTDSVLMNYLLQEQIDGRPSPGLCVDAEDMSGFHFYLYKYLPELKVIAIVVRSEGWEDVFFSTSTAEELGIDVDIQPPEALDGLDTPLDGAQMGDLKAFCEDTGGLVAFISEVPGPAPFDE